MSDSSLSIRLLTVDAAGTLVRPWPSVGSVYGRTAREYGIDASDEDVDKNFYSAFGKLQVCKKTNGGEEKEFWRKVVAETFRPFSGDKDIDPLFEDLWNLFARGDCWKLAEGAMDTLKTLRDRGYELAVLSNNDSRLRTVLTDLQIDQVFHHLFISSEMGCEKPDPEIFRQVETVTGKKPAEILHLGDSHSRDFLGARNAGWSALLYGEPKLEDEQITHFSELPHKVIMIEVHCIAPLERLHSLGTDTLVIRANPKGGWTGYLDFSEVKILNLENTRGQIEKLNSSTKQGTRLSFSGWVGFFGYEFLARHFGATLTANRDLSIPDGWFGRPSTVLHIQEARISIESALPERASEIAKLIENSCPAASQSFLANNRRCNLSFEEYEKIFHQAREAILDGETYQIKISQRFEAEATIDPLLAFAKLSESNPAPEAFLLQTTEFSLVSCSPEVVIEKTGNRILTRPIGGTYARNSSGSDQSVIEQFLNDSKEVSEHNMLVDLERNDLSTLCTPGTVHLERFREVETYSHLHHLVSTIHGVLKQDTSLSNILQGMLPGGSITGCPKMRTMEWIDKLEPCFRGPYTGSFGIIEDSGDLRLNLIIRSMLILGERCYTQAGGGIVVDSTPEYEYRENQIKAQALLDLLS